MAERTVKVKLVADVSEYTAGLIKAAAQTRTLGQNIERNIDRDINPVMRRSGEKSGGLLAQGFRSGFIRNSPLIAAAVGGALAAGAPVALAGASVLFGGIGAIAAAQSTRVRDAWTDLGHDIRDGAIEDASVLVPVYERMADKIGAAFERMRPEIRDAFEAAAPQIDTFTDSLTRAAENALPGLVRAVERGEPVIEGLGSLMESIGTGLSDFFDAMSDDNADAAGQAFEAIGEALEEALPLLGELLGTGAEIAAMVLPPLADALGAVHEVARVLAPVLPALVTGFIGFKAAQAAAGYMQTFAVQAQYAAVAMTGSVTAGQRLGGALSDIGRSLPVAAAAFGVVTAVMQRAEEQGRLWAEAIEEGGRAAATARAEMSNFHTAMEVTNTGWEGFVTALVGPGARFAVTAQAIREAEEATKDMGRAAEYAPEPLGLVVTKFNDMQTAADDAKQATDNFKLSLDILTGAHVSMIEVESAFQSALAAAAGALEGMSGSVLDGAGNLNLQSEAGRTAADVLLGVRDSGNQLIGTMIQQGATADEVNAKDAQLRQSFIDTAIQMGISEEAAHLLADQILGIPEERKTTISADTTAASTAVSNLQAQIDGMRGKTVTVKVVTDRAALAVYAAQNGMQTVGGYAFGGYTGPGGKYDPAGIVHKGEVVWSQEDVAAHGGPQRVDRMRRSRGYADGGIVVQGDSSDLRDAMQDATDLMARSLVALHGPATANGVGGLGPAAARAHQFVRSNWGFGGTIGGYANRNIAGTNVKSKHALGKAIDVMTGRNMGLGQAIADYFSGPGRGPFGVDNVIWNRRINSGRGWGPYRGVSPHTDHPHIDFYKTGTGFVPHDGLAYLHKGEAVVPAEMNTPRSREFGGGGTASSSVVNHTDARRYVNNVSAGPNAQQIARAVMDAQRDLEFLHG